MNTSTSIQHHFFPPFPLPTTIPLCIVIAVAPVDDVAIVCYSMPITPITVMQTPGTDTAIAEEIAFTQTSSSLLVPLQFSP